MNRPFGVSLLALYLTTQSLINIIVLYGYYSAGFPLFTFVYYTATSITGFLLAYGMFKGEPWGRYGTMLFSGFEILVGLVSLYASLNFAPMSPTEAVTSIMVNAILIYYMTRPEVVGFFKKD